MGTVHELPRAIKEIERTPIKNHYNGNDGGNGGGGTMLEVRVTKLEADVENIKTNLAEARADIRLLTQNSSSIKTDVSVILQKLVDIEANISKKPSASEMTSAIASATNKQIVWTVGLAITILGVAKYIF